MFSQSTCVPRRYLLTRSLPLSPLVLDLFKLLICYSGLNPFFYNVLLGVEMYFPSDLFDKSTMAVLNHIFFCYLMALFYSAYTRKAMIVQPVLRWHQMPHSGLWSPHLITLQFSLLLLHSGAEHLSSMLNF